MTQGNRHRLTGALFLLALAAILLPMLFDGEGVAPIQLDPVEAPEVDVQVDDAPPPDPSAALAARRELEAVIDEDGFARDTGTRIGEPSLLEEGHPSIAEHLKWAVQVAAFAQAENAKSLRDRLLADGYAAFLSSAKRDGQVTARVAVGPFINHDDAARLQAELDRRYEFGAVLVRFSP